MTDRGDSERRNRDAAAMAPAPVAADVGIVAALPMEVGYLTDQLKKVRRYSGPRFTVIEGEHREKLIAVVVSGMGQASARSACEILIQGHQPRWVVSPGFAGALHPGLKRNDVIIPNTLLNADGGRLSIDVKLPPTTNPAGVQLVTGSLLTVDRLILKAREKAEYHARFGADVVDMETWAVASLCSSLGLRFLSIRIVSDDAHGDLPAEIADLSHRRGMNLVGAAMRSIWNRPASLKDLLRLQAHGVEAADQLARVTLDVIERLPA